MFIVRLNQISFNYLVFSSLDSLVSGIAAARQPIMLVMEFVPNGALNSFLKQQKNKNNFFSSYELIQMCEDAANGILFLQILFFIFPIFQK